MPHPKTGESTARSNRALNTVRWILLILCLASAAIWYWGAPKKAAVMIAPVPTAGRVIGSVDTGAVSDSVAVSDAVVKPKPGRVAPLSTRTPLNPSSAVVKPVSAEGYLAAGFDVLAGWDAESAWDPETDEVAIPSAIAALTGKKVAVGGYMIPIGFDDADRVREFVLVRDQMSCCYGMSPPLNYFAVVRVKKPVECIMDVPVTVMGTLKVGAYFEEGELAGIYRLEAERVEIPKEALGLADRIRAIRERLSGRSPSP